MSAGFSQPSLMVSPLISLLKRKMQTKKFSIDQLIFSPVSILVNLTP